MWFKQISFYPLNKEKLPEADVLADKLAEAEFTHCQGLDWFSEGFTAPVSFSPELVFPADFTLRVALKKRKSPARRRHPRYFGREGSGNPKQ